MQGQHGPARPSARAGLRVLLAGTLVFGAVGSCELPKPKLPSIGWAPPSPAAAREAPAPPSTAATREAPAPALPSRFAVAAPPGPPREPS